MLKYILKRVFIFIPTVIAISLITFIISLNAPGDPVEQMLSSGQGENQIADKLATEKAYMNLRRDLGLDGPVFYFSFSSLASCDTLYHIQNQRHRKNLNRLLYEYGNWEEISKYYHTLRKLELELYKVKKDSSNAPALIKTKELIIELLTTHKEPRILKLFEELESVFSMTASVSDVSMMSTEQRVEYEHLFLSQLSLHDLKENLYSAKDAYADMLRRSTIWKRYVPSIHFYGVHNQYHRWFTHFIRGDFGKSYQDKRPVSFVIWDALRWTVIISLIAIIITYVVAVPIGVKSAVMKGTLKDQTITTILFIFYSLPNFWIATLLIIFLGGGDYFDWFPPYGVGDLSDDAPFTERFLDLAHHLILPLFCLTYPTFAFLSRQGRGGMLNVLNQDYIRTARAKGLPERKVIWKHSFRNALLPVITLFANVFPYAIAGSVVVEVIFSIPGMGKLAYEAIIARNYPIVYTVVMFSSILTLVGYLVADILYAVVDPRISYSAKSK